MNAAGFQIAVVPSEIDVVWHVNLYDGARPLLLLGRVIIHDVISEELHVIFADSCGE
jgi:hypothetical protein